MCSLLCSYSYREPRTCAPCAGGGRPAALRLRLGVPERGDAARVHDGRSVPRGHLAGRLRARLRGALVLGRVQALQGAPPLLIVSHYTCSLVISASYLYLYRSRDHLSGDHLIHVEHSSIVTDSVCCSLLVFDHVRKPAELSHSSRHLLSSTPNILHFVHFLSRSLSTSLKLRGILNSFLIAQPLSE